MTKENIMQAALFENAEQNTKAEKDGRIFVSQMSYISSFEQNQSELFSGYNELYSITYSYSLGEISKVMESFGYGEIIVGCANMVSYSLAELLVAQNYILKECKNKYLSERINADELRIFVLNSMISHEKIYLLKNGSNGYRTILASANFSGVAWKGGQRENFVVCDDRECFDVYMERFTALKEQCSFVPKNALCMGENGENIEEIPILKKAHRDGVLIVDVSGQSKETEKFDYYLKTTVPDVKKLLTKANIKNGNKGVVEITAEKIEKLIVKNNEEQVKIIEEKNNFPQFIINYDESSVFLNGNKFDLNPSEDKVKHDIELLEEYMDGFNKESFIGDVEKLRNIYWKVLNYMFISPFVARIRHEIGNDDWLRYCPIYLLLSGSSDAGKTAFVKLVRKMMFGIRYSRALLNNKNFLTESSLAIKLKGRGFPAIIDELTTSQWAQASNIVKNDAHLIDEHYTNHPCFILIANELNGVKPEISKRVMVLNPDCRMPRDLAMKNGGIVKTIGDKMGTALYRLYLRKIFEKFPEFVDGISAKTSVPDIWELSSGTLRDIFDYFGVFPEFQKQNWQDYVGEKTICDKAITLLLNEYANNPQIFSVQRKSNKLFVDFSSYDANEVQSIVRTLTRELPTVFSCKKINANKLKFSLKAIEDFTGIKFTDSKFRAFCEKFLGKKE